MTKAWLEAGFRTEQVDTDSGSVVFRVTPPVGPKSVAGMAEEPRAFSVAYAKKPRRHPAFGALKGTFWIEPGYDVTKPAMDEDELAAWEARLEEKFDAIENGMKGKRP